MWIGSRAGLLGWGGPCRSSAGVSCSAAFVYGLWFIAGLLLVGQGCIRVGVGQVYWGGTDHPEVARGCLAQELSVRLHAWFRVWMILRVVGLNYSRAQRIGFRQPLPIGVGSPLQEYGVVG